MYSNFVTPPDFVKDNLHTVTVVDATVDDVELLGLMCQHTNESFNIYLYRNEMNNIEWLNKAIALSDAVIVNPLNNNEELLKNSDFFYYGNKIYLSPATKVNNVLHYFLTRQEKMQTV